MTEPSAATASQALWTRRFFWLLLAVLLLRAAYLWLGVLDLDPDEAYYWDWSRQLDWGYYSKPPLIAWVNALSTGVWGASTLTVRLPSVLFGGISLAGIFALGRSMFDARVGFWAALLFTATPAAAALSFFMTTDALLICSLMLALNFFWRAVQRPERLGLWTAAGIAIGFGLLSKQMMAVFLLLLLLFLLTGPERRLLRGIGPWLMTATALVFLVPGVVWNARHQWITVQHTAHHMDRPFGGLKTLGEFLGSQALLFGPVVWLLLGAVGGYLLVRLLRQQPAVRLLLLCSLAGLAVFVLMSIRQRINANWPGAYYPAGLILLAAWFCGRIDTDSRLDRWRRVVPAGVVLGAALALLLYLVPPAYDLLGLSGGKRDPLAKRRGWAELGRQVGAVLERQPQPQQTLLISGSRMYAAAMAFYVPGHPQATRWPGESGEVTCQYEIWGVGRAKAGWDALILLPEGEPLAAELAARFQQVEAPQTLVVPVGAAGTRRFALYRAQGLTAWPGW